jgi:DNA gyrase subunit A
MDKAAELVKLGRIKEIGDMRDETDLGGLKLAIDLKRGADPDRLMQRLMRMTPLMDSFSCNFNILIAGNPRVMGVREILEEWTAWRTDCVRRRVFFELSKKRDKLHLLIGLKKILLDIDKAIAIIRGTELETEVVPNLMIGFGIDREQAEFVAEIRLRNINREYILRRVEETEQLEKDIADLEDMLSSPRRIKKLIIDELSAMNKKFPSPRRTELVYSEALSPDEPQDEIADYPVTLFLSREGYFKKITPLSLRMGGEQKYKENDGPAQEFEASNRDELLIFTDRQQVYKVRASDFEDSKASVLGSFLPARLEMDEGENVLCMAAPGDYSGHLLLFYANGKAARIELTAYATKTNRRRLTGAYSDKSPLVSVLPLGEERELAAFSTEGRAMIFSSALLAPKSSRTTIGVTLMTLKPRFRLEKAMFSEQSPIRNAARYRARHIPAAGALLREEDREEKQLSLTQD